MGGVHLESGGLVRTQSFIVAAGMENIAWSK